MNRSLVLYTNNSEKYIGKLLDKVIDKLDETKEELIIIDDMSTDNTVPIIIEKIGYFFTDEEHYKFYINRPRKGRRNSLKMAKEVATTDKLFTINEKYKMKRIKV